MGKKIYDKWDGGIRVIDERQQGFTAISNYIADLWTPLIGHAALSVYLIYARLGREKEVKAISQRELADGLRMGKDTLRKANDTLEDCGFIKVEVPEGYKKSMHWTTSVRLLEPPKEISQDLIDKYAKPSGYKPLSPWLVTDKKDEKSDPKTQIGLSYEDPDRSLVDPDRTANIEDLNIEDLDTEDLDKECAKARKVFEEEEPEDKKEKLEWLDRKSKSLKDLGDKLSTDRKMPIDWIAVQAVLRTTDKSEAELEKERERRILDAKNVEREQFIGNMRSWVAPAFIDIAIAFHEATEIKPVGESERKLWVKGFNRLYQKGIKPEDVTLGVRRMRELSLAIKSPLSVEVYASEAKRIREKYERQTFG